MNFRFAGKKFPGGLLDRRISKFIAEVSAPAQILAISDATYERYIQLS